jgi:hypothetical protein
LERLRKEKQKKGEGIKDVPPPSQEERVRQTIIQLHQEMKNTFRFKKRDQARDFFVKEIFYEELYLIWSIFVRFLCAISEPCQVVCKRYVQKLHRIKVTSKLFVAESSFKGIASSNQYFFTGA